MRYLFLLFLVAPSCTLFFFTQRFDCGDNVIKSGEECDDGNTTDGDGCDALCLLEVCGNGILQAPEQCDDGALNANTANTCHLNCTLPRCGDTFLDVGEQCDDGNNIAGDTCDAACLTEFCGDNTLNNNNREQCDDGNLLEEDGCNSACIIEECGDGIIQAGLTEECDDGAIINGDGCNAACIIEECGDGIIQTGLTEECDDTNTSSGDGCSDQCVIEFCGDALVNTPNEVCEDGNLEENDGCDNDCLASGAVQVELGGAHSCAISRQGDIRCWGAGVSGQLGNEASASFGDNEPASALNDIKIGALVEQITAGDAHSCALLDTENVRCWGNGGSGRLGYGNTNNFGDNLGETPELVGDVDLGGPVKQIAAGATHTCAVLVDGKVFCWGEAGSGQLGYGNTIDIGDNETPLSAGSVSIGGLANQIAVGTTHTCAVLVDGKVRCWGEAGSGQLGYGNLTDIGKNEPPSVVAPVNLGANVVITQVSAGNDYNCALTNDGKVFCWGINLNGQLGYGNINTIGDNEQPVAAGPVTVGGTVAQLALGSVHSCALLTNGRVRCWGNAGGGQLGYANINFIGNDANEFPSTVGDVNIGGLATQIAAGDFHTCAVLDTGTIRCWGLANSGQLGYGNINNIGDNELPAQAGDVPLF
jgi:cysteine-rich repeat protein